MEDALLPDRLELLEEHARVHHHARADQVHGARLQDARGHQVEHRALAVHDEGVPRVVPALEAHHQLGGEREAVDDLALALVAPLGADGHDGGHFPRSTS